jgi:hypothetical protein
MIKKDEVLNALQNAGAYLESMDCFSEMTDEQIDIHHQLGDAFREHENKILNYFIRLLKKNNKHLSK